jgi:peptidoglycan hydrolase CwlO-like protein
MKDKKKKEEKNTPTLPVPAIETLSINFTRAIGTPLSVLFHTIFFAGIFLLRLAEIPLDQIMLILTTAVSLEAIYLAIFIQMSINRQEAKLHEVREDIEEIAEDIEDIQEDVEELGEDFEEITEDISEIQEDVEELGEDFDEISGELDEEDKKEEEYRAGRNENLQKMEATLQSIIEQLEKMKIKDTGRRGADDKKIDK